MREALAEFYEKNFDSYVKRITRKAGGPENAEDIVQEAFYRALKFIDTAPPNGSAGMDVWFNTIVRRSMYDFKRVELRQGMATDAEREAEPEAREISGVDLIMADEIEKEIESRRDPTHKQVLYLAFLKHYPPRDIVQILDLPVSTVHTITNRFKGEMDERYGFDRSSKIFS